MSNELKRRPPTYQLQTADDCDSSHDTGAAMAAAASPTRCGRAYPQTQRVKRAKRNRAPGHERLLVGCADQGGDVSKVKITVYGPDGVARQHRATDLGPGKARPLCKQHDFFERVTCRSCSGKGYHVRRANPGHVLGGERDSAPCLTCGNKGIVLTKRGAAAVAYWKARLDAGATRAEARAQAYAHQATLDKRGKAKVASTVKRRRVKWAVPYL